MSDQMSDDEHRLRASGQYATYRGRVHFAHRVRNNIRLFSNDDPLPPGFVDSPKDWVRGEAFVPVSEVDRLERVRTICIWRGQPFELGIVIGDSANVTYLGKHFDEVSELPGMTRPDKYEVKGTVPVSELTDVQEHVDEVPLDLASSETQRRDHE